MLIAAGIGTRPPRRVVEGRIVSARCYGSLTTLDPTGVVLVRPTLHGRRLTIADLFHAWGQPLTPRRLASFASTGDTGVQAFVNGRRWTASPPAQIPLTPHAEIVLETGPHVPPHSAYRFSPQR